jgi:hypothetical protein
LHPYRIPRASPDRESEDYLLTSLLDTGVASLSGGLEEIAAPSPYVFVVYAGTNYNGTHGQRCYNDFNGIDYAPPYPTIGSAFLFDQTNIKNVGGCPGAFSVTHSK